LRRALIALVVAGAVVAPGSLGAHPAKGTAAPPLDSLELLQAPSGASASWASLRGKVVVLEFWATWCSPCVASLPHLNQLVESLDVKRFQFISIDDENVEAVRTFLSRKKMSGWVGIDAAGKVFARYGVISRPTTVVVDGNGKVVAVTEIDAVSADDLRAVAEGKKVDFKASSEVAEVTAPSAPTTASGGQSLFAVSVTKALADEQPSLVKHPPTGWDMLGRDADSLMTDLFDPFGNRYVLKDALPAGRYDVRVNSVDVPQAVTDAVVRQAVLAALHLQIQPKTVTKAAYVLRATDASRKLLSPSASTHAVKRGYWHGIFILMNGTMDDLAYVLATGLETPVVNETGITGTYDARLKVSGGDVESLNAVLKEAMGLELVAGGKEMPLSVLEVSRRDEGKAPSQATAEKVERHVTR
jgi:thiol-disulfide isomerase/thioredoxin